MRHSAREAAARCVSCSGYFCRECVSEHGGTIYCAPCLAAKTVATGKASKGRNWFAPLKRLALFGVSVFVLWSCFYLAAARLRRIPPELHDGTLFQNLAQGK